MAISSKKLFMNKHINKYFSKKKKKKQIQVIEYGCTVK